MSDSADASMIALGFDLFAMKLYWVAASTLWVIEYFETLHDEVECAWKGRKTSVFYLFLVNRYYPLCVILLTYTAWFAKSFTAKICSRYSFMEPLDALVLAATAEIFLTLRVYALTKRHKGVLCVTAIILLWQCGIILYSISQVAKSTVAVAVLMSRAAPALPTVPNTDPYHLCLFLPPLIVKSWLEAFLCLSLSFDGLAFIALTFLSIKALHRSRSPSRMLWVIRNDGIMYFFVLFSSNLVWILLFIYGRPSLQFIHNEPAVLISSIMITRITLNLKRASLKDSVTSIPWGIKTFEERDHDGTNSSALESFELSRIDDRN